MKKYLYCLIFIFLSFIPILKVNASTSTNLEIIEDENYNKVFEWLYNTSNDFLLNIGYDDNYRTIYMNNTSYNSTTGEREYAITIVTSNVENNIVNTYQNNVLRGLILINPFPKRYTYIIKTTDFINYSNRNNITISNIENAYFGESTNSTSDDYIYQTSNASLTFTNFRIYFSNMIIRNSTNTNVTNRTLTLYNTENELIGTYSAGDLLPSYVSIYHNLPPYLTGYERVGLTPSDNTIIISNIEKGSIYISVEDFNKCTGLFGYFDKDLISQPYSSVITDYTKTLDGLYIRQDFDISSYPGADYVYYQKCQIVDNTDDIYKYIWLPDTSYNSNITSTENNSGGLDYSYNVEENGEIVENTFSSLDNILDSTNPLLNDFFNNFSTNYFGISSIITAPLSLINQLSSSTCSPILLPFPYSNNNLTLPCMSEIYEDNFGQLYTLYQFILLGFVSYRIGVSIFYDIKKLKDPNNDEVEVINL